MGHNSSQISGRRSPTPHTCRLYSHQMPPSKVAISAVAMAGPYPNRRSIRSARKARSSRSPAVAPGRSTTVASGRSPHFSSGTATTAASATSGWPIRAFSSSTEEIHSPPDLMTSLARSVRVR